MKKYLLVFFSFYSLCLFGQNESVQTFTYESTTRDTIIDFPEGDHNRFEKIIMYYSMRCKDALVSTGSERNKGCGEWDYSCNTYLVDSSYTDSVKSTHPNYIISNFSGTDFNYTTTPSNNYYQYTQKKITYTDTTTRNVFDIGAGTDS